MGIIAFIHVDCNAPGCQPPRIRFDNRCTWTKKIRIPQEKRKNHIVDHTDLFSILISLRPTCPIPHPEGRGILKNWVIVPQSPENIVWPPNGNRLGLFLSPLNKVFTAWTYSLRLLHWGKNNSLLTPLPVCTQMYIAEVSYRCQFWHPFRCNIGVRRREPDTFLGVYRWGVILTAF